MLPDDPRLRVRRDGPVRRLVHGSEPVHHDHLIRAGPAGRAVVRLGCEKGLPWKNKTRCSQQSLLAHQPWIYNWNTCRCTTSDIGNQVHRLPRPKSVLKSEALQTHQIAAEKARIDHQLDPPHVAEQMWKLHSSVYAWRRYENKVRTDPTLLGGRRRLIVCWGTAAVGGLDVLYHQAPKVAAREPARAACAQNAGAHPPGGGMMVIVQSTQVLDWQRSKSHLIYERVAVILSRCLTACFISSCTEVLRRRSFLLPQ